jgi:hypothetical protein
VHAAAHDLQHGVGAARDGIEQFRAVELQYFIAEAELAGVAHAEDED